MDLITDEIKFIFRTVGTQRGSPDPMVIVRLYCENGALNWYIIEYDFLKNNYYGYLHNIRFIEKSCWGTFSVKNMEEIHAPFGPLIVLDRDFIEKPISELVPGIENNSSH